MNPYDPTATRAHLESSLASVSLKEQSETEIRSLVIASYVAGMAIVCEQIEAWLNEVETSSMTLEQMKARVKQLWQSAAEEATDEMAGLGKNPK